MGRMKELESTSTLFGANAPFIEELYERYLSDPAAVPAEWRGYFDELRGDEQHWQRRRAGLRGGDQRGGPVADEHQPAVGAKRIATAAAMAAVVAVAMVPQLVSVSVTFHVQVFRTA